MQKSFRIAIIFSIFLIALLFLSTIITQENSTIIFLGRFHPIILHIPIGALLGLFFLEIIAFFAPKTEMGKATSILLWFSAFSTLPAVIAGFFLASGGGYDDETLNLHKWLGWFTSLICIWLLVLKYRSSISFSAMKLYRGALFANVVLLSLAGHFGGALTHGSNYLTYYMPGEMKTLLGISSDEDKLSAIASRDENSEEAQVYKTDIQPLLNTYCYQCHDAKKQKGNVRLDLLDWNMIQGNDAEGWHAALDMINSGEMPPEEEKQFTNKEREQLVNWITNSLEEAAEYKKATYVGTMRRLTKKQYTNSLISLLNLPVNFGEVLPDDGKSEMGFSNNAEVLQTSSLHIDYYQKIAREALDKAIVNGEKPKPYKYRVTLGEGIGVEQPSAEFKGYQTKAIKSNDLIVEFLSENHNPIQPLNEEDQLQMDSIKNNIGIGMRGSTSERYKIVKEGLMLSSALPAIEVAPKSWQGPSPNMKLLIADTFPREGDFVLRVEASKGYPYQTDEDKYISLREYTPALNRNQSIILKAKNAKAPEFLRLQNKKWLVTEDVSLPAKAEFSYHVPESGYYMVELVHPYVSDDGMPSYTLGIFGRGQGVSERLYIPDSLSKKESIVRPVTLAYLKKGTHRAVVGGTFFVGFSEIRIIPIAANDPLPDMLAKEVQDNFLEYDSKNPSIRAFAGSRTDDGMDYRNFDEPKEVTVDFGKTQQFEFKGRLENLPIPNDQSLTSGHLSGIFTFGLWNNYLVKDASSAGPPLLIKSIEIEAPYYPVWPPESHTSIFFDSPNSHDKNRYTKEILSSFLEKAFRRPAEPEELDRYFNFWKSSKDEFDTYEDGVKEILVAILCSPNFLYYYEAEDSINNKTKDDFFIASELSYFLWNSSPDKELIDLSAKGELVDNIDNQVERMVKDSRITEMIESFTFDWLRLDRHKGMNTDMSEYEDYTRFVKEDMAHETNYFIEYLLKENMSILNMIDSDFAMLNQNLAEFYGIEGIIGSEFRPVKLSKGLNRGGLLSQGAFLNGHSNGVQAHPIKRAVWLKEKILGDPAPPPPPNVPELDPDIPGIENMTLKDQLFLHRNKASCLGCHQKIDPFGVVFENYDAVGRYNLEAKGKPIDAKSILPDGVEVEGVQGIKDYILKYKSEDFTKSLVEHLYAYALGRDISFADEEEIQRIVAEVVKDDYKFQTVVKEIVLSPSFIRNNKKGWLAQLGL